MQITAAKPTNTASQTAANLFLCLICLAFVLVIPFYRSLEAGQVLFANDGPLGASRSQQWALPEGFHGIWLDTNWLGQSAGSFFYNSFTLLFLNFVGPVANAKFYVPTVLLLSGMSAALFFRTLGARWSICTLGGLAAMLNSNFFSNAAWGLGTRGTTLAANFLAMAVLTGFKDRPIWLRLPLAGLLVGEGVVEGADNGAIFSLYFAAYVVFHAWQELEGTAIRRLAIGAARVAVVAACAGFMAYQTVHSLIGTQVTGIASMNQKNADTKVIWDWATQWSLPKAEILRVVVPGLFGYRLDTEEGGNYWGTVGRQPGWELNHQGFPRHSGAGEYAGVLVVFVAGWAVAMAWACRKQEKTFTVKERRYIWFWAVAFIISALFAFGRHAPFYQFIYPLPFFKSIRNPMKFMHPGHLALMILFAYGLIGLYRRHIENVTASSKQLGDHLKAWWGKARGFDRTWVRNTVLLVPVFFLVWLLYASSRTTLQAHLVQEGFDGLTAQAIAGFSGKEVGWSVLFLALSVGAVLLIVSGWMAGSRARIAGIVLGLILVVDLSRANSYWVRYLDADRKYALNSVIEILRDKPYEHRVQLLPVKLVQQQLAIAQQQMKPNEVQMIASLFSQLHQVYSIEWMQHLFLNENVQCLDVIQMPRVSEEYQKYLGALQNSDLRNWQLTDTRYILTIWPLDQLLNPMLDPQKQRFKVRARFDMPTRPGVTNATLEDLTTVITNNGNFVLMEFTGALPRAKFYNLWEPAVPDDAALARLTRPEFDPTTAVMVADAINPPPAGSVPAADAGTAEITAYQPKDIRIKVNAKTAGVLLLNDKYDKEWQVTVDGKPGKVLRCNFIMRGVEVPAGAHEVEFRFEPVLQGIQASIAAMAGAVLLFVVLMVYPGKPKAPTAPAAPEPPAPAQPVKRS